MHGHASGRGWTVPPSCWRHWVAKRSGAVFAPGWLPVFMAAGVAGLFRALRFEPAVVARRRAGRSAGAAGRRIVLARAAAGRPPRRWRAAALGFAAAQLATLRAPAARWTCPRHAVVVTGTVRAVEPLPEGRRVTLEARVSAGRRRPAARAGCASACGRRRRLPVATGDTLRVRALLCGRAPPAYPGAWDLQRDAFFAGLGGSGFALGPAQRAGGRRAAPGPPALVQRLREAIAGRIDRGAARRRRRDRGHAADRRDRRIPEADHAAFRDAGLAHLLAVAGLHIGIVMGLVFAAVAPRARAVGARGAVLAAPSRSPRWRRWPPAVATCC